MSRWVFGIAWTAALLLSASVGRAELPVASRQSTWPVAAVGTSVPLVVFRGPRTAVMAPAAAPPAIIYLKNLAGPRIGTESDEAILADLVHDGFVVLVLDFAHHPRAVAPHLNADLRLMRRGIGRLFQGETIDADHVYILAAGDRLKRDIVYYGQGDKAYRLDIRYPSRPARPSPVLVQIPVSNDDRMNNRVGHYKYNDLVAEGALTRGYAVAQIDPPLKKYAGIDTMPEVACRLKAAVRTIRAQGAAWGLSDRIGVMGFSRSSGQAAILAMSGGIAQLEGDGPHREYSSRVQAAVLHAGRMDHELLVKSGEPIGKLYIAHWGQPVAKEELDKAQVELKRLTQQLDARDAVADCARADRSELHALAAQVGQMQRTFDRWQSHSAVHYVTPDDPPTFLCVGAKDEYRPEQIRRMAEALKHSGVPCEHVVVPGMGHEVVGDEAVLGRIYGFLDKHLRPAGGAGMERRDAASAKSPGPR